MPATALPAASTADPPPGRPAELGDREACYQAFVSRDARFDGRLYVGVTSTGVYCRPVCRVRTPMLRNCRFFASAARAEGAGFRPCLRCRPELAPGLAFIDTPRALADRAAQLLQRAAAQGEAVALPTLADKLGVTDRHLRRVFTELHGVAPLAFLTTQRLLLAKQLLCDTALPITEVAMASGFGSLRRFNTAFATQYRLTPTDVRRRVGPEQRVGPGAKARRRAVGAHTGSRASVKDVAASGASVATAADATRARCVSAHAEAPAVMPATLEATDHITMQLGYRPPYDRAGMLAFLARRAVPGLEEVVDGRWRRSLVLSHQGRTLAGWIEVGWSDVAASVQVRAAAALAPALGELRAAVSQALDLHADPAAMAETLARVPGPERPGLRLPGALGAGGGFEAAVRVVLGQQVSVAAARTLTARLVAQFGAPVVTPWPAVTHAFPAAAVIAAAPAEAIGSLGIVRQRVRALQALAQAVVDGLRLEAGADLATTMAALQALPGIGPWTAELIALRALAWPDAFAASDLGVLQALEGEGGRRDVKAAEAASQAWRPWRAYALMKLWLALETQDAQ